MSDQEQLKSFLPSIPFTSDAGETIVISSVTVLSEELRQRFLEALQRAPANFSPFEILSDVNIICLHLHATPNDQVAFVNPATNKAKLIELDEAIFYEPVSPFQVVEYCFDGIIYA